MRERGLRETEAMEMIAAQMPAELKRARADYIIENDGTFASSRNASATCGTRSSERPTHRRRRPRFLDAPIGYV